MVTTEVPFARVEAAARPFRLWDARNKKHLIGRNYGTELAAINGAIILMYWSKIGESIEVYDVTSGRLVRQFTRKVNAVADFDPKRLRRAA